MEWVWNWGGDCFGYKEENSLWSYEGFYVGEFFENEIYDPNGKYLGEVMSENRLITNLSKKSNRKPAFGVKARRIGYAPYAGYIGNIMYVGYEDFPKASNFK